MRPGLSANVSLKTLSTISPASLLPADEGPIQHDPLEALETVYASGLDLSNGPIAEPDGDLCSDGNNFMDNGSRYAVETAAAKGQGFATSYIS